ncbi:MAG TPA: 3-oxoacyl-[acyl-carrier-protein] reductase [Fibrobacteraceae bacterium]|jgi:3-oxoacyl-[acyl-carrier protein] reductase|nr:3-oxoacyl-[acyl-carrier-protein] reductase [Fibrobacter sp.]HOG67747.1 3-oxoacyl-[acyl-carrier-protein] reductase [Fibrobacteraceae bacterium]HPW93660.1 3-oxoacyl-[acyl-carrier-protein] reductase [Fibrobacteraceae bacterium]HQB64758.1 3-oxoacyl-[acyl-carrier-protein] reductase [Fibrobacteraceae bacterium]
MINLKEKTAIVTGASRGIGLEITRVLASRGANIAMIATKENKELASSLEAEFNVKIVSYACDVSSSEMVESTFKNIIETFGAVDILVNNAGITRDGLLMRMKDEDFDDVLRINLRSVFICTKAVARHMMGRRQGRIINMASINGIRTQAGQANYAASKAGVIGITKSNSMEFAARGVTVNAVAPGFIQTDMTAKLNEDTINKFKENIPMKDLGKPADVANLVAFLASDEARYITGQIIGVDGGLNA